MLGEISNYPWGQAGHETGLCKAKRLNLNFGLSQITSVCGET
jgi:hypothetical protein